MVDWSLARHIARFAAGAGATPPSLGHVDFAGLVSETEGHLRAYTRLEPVDPIPAPEAVGRAEWAEVNIDSLAGLLGPVVDRLTKRLESAGPLAGALRAAGNATVAAEVGLVMGYMSQRVLGQYELSLLEPERPARLLFVDPNLAKAIRDLDVDAGSFL